MGYIFLLNNLVTVRLDAPQNLAPDTSHHWYGALIYY